MASLRVAYPSFKGWGLRDAEFVVLCRSFHRGLQKKVKGGGGSARPPPFPDSDYEHNSFRHLVRPILNLEGSKVGDAGLFALASALPRQTFFRVLNLSYLVVQPSRALPSYLAER